MNYWMFRPLAGFLQGFEWKTDIIRSKASEQRIALRALPRVQYSFKHKLDRKNYQVAKAAMLTGFLFQIPDWGLRFHVTITPGINVVLNIGPHHFQVGDSVTIWKSDTLYEILTVSAKTLTSITIPVILLDGECIVMKMVEAYCQGGMSGAVTKDNLIDVSMNMSPTLPIDFGSYTPTTYLGKAVFPFQCVIESNLNERVTWATEEVDNDLGKFEMFSDRTEADSVFAIRTLLNDSNTLAMAQWLQSRVGRQKDFYVSSGYNDFVLASNTSAGSAVLRVFGKHETLDTKWITITYPDGSTVNFEVLSTSAAPILGGEQTSYITLTTNLATAVLTTQNIKISKLMLARHDTDRIELIHGTHNANLVGLSINCLALKS